jgi:hypothetical protein
MFKFLTPDVATIIVILLFALAVVAIITVAASKSRNRALDIINRSLEQGKSLEPEMIERLLPPRPSDRGLLMPGIMTAALGIGLAAAALITGNDVTRKVFSGIVLLCLGIGLVITAVIARRQSR